jgi:hypothetical protein
MISFNEKLIALSVSKPFLSYMRAMLDSRMEGLLSKENALGAA